MRSGKIKRRKKEAKNTIMAIRDELPFIFGILAIFILVSLSIFSLSCTDNASPDDVAQPREKLYSQRLGKGVCVRSEKHPDIDLVKVGSCRIEKINKGGFSFGGFNTLLIDDLQINFPQSAEHPLELFGYRSANAAETPDSAQSLIAASIKRLVNADVRIATFAVNNLDVFTVDANGDKELLLHANLARPELSRSRLILLKECRYRDATGAIISTDQAKLLPAPPFSLFADNKHVHFAHILNPKEHP